MSFGAKTIAERTGPGMRNEVEETSYKCYAYSTSSSQEICAVIVANKEYPRLVAHQHLGQMMEEFTSQHPRKDYQNIAKDPRSDNDPIPWPALQERYLNPKTRDNKENKESWQDPNNGSNIDQVQRELIETKNVLHKTIESVLERGEKIDNLVAKSDGLSASSKMFYSQAKKQNSCCVVM